MQTTFDTLSNRLECHNVPRLPRKTTCQPALTASKRIGFAASPRDTARPEENQRLETRYQNEHFVRDFLQFSQFVASESTFSDEFSHEPQNLRPQNRSIPDRIFTIMPVSGLHRQLAANRFPSGMGPRS